jgi:glutamyl/glutaminyl-tRNA synthetase
MQLFRVVVTGVGGGPNMFEIMELIGKEESIKRMNLFLERNK